MRALVSLFLFLFFIPAVLAQESDSGSSGPDFPDIDIPSPGEIADAVISRLSSFINDWVKKVIADIYEVLHDVVTSILDILIRQPILWLRDAGVAFIQGIFKTPFKIHGYISDFSKDFGVFAPLVDALLTFFAAFAFLVIGVKIWELMTSAASYLPAMRGIKILKKLRRLL